MSESREPVEIRRILVALDASRASLRVLEAAAALAERVEAELLGVFVEDVNLLRLAALPFAREVGFTSARARRLESADMERSLRAQATLAQRALESAAVQRRLRWSFRVLRGRVISELLSAAEEADMLALAMSGLAASRGARLGSTAQAMLSGAPRSLLVLPPDVEVRAPVTAIYDGTSTSMQALLFAARLAATETDDGLTVLLLADDPDEEQARREEVRSRLVPLGVAARFRWIVEIRAETLARAARENAAGTLVLAAESPVLRADAVRKLLEAVDCAVLLVR